jgi:hypothetical protein
MRAADDSWPHLAVDVEGQLLRAGYQRLPLILVMTTLIPVLASLIWWRVLPHQVLLIWCLTCWACVASAYLLWRAFQRARHTPATHSRWQRLFVGQSLLAGVAWGTGPSLFMPYTAATPELTLFLGLLLCVCGGSRERAVVVAPACCCRCGCCCFFGGGGGYDDGHQRRSARAAARQEQAAVRCAFH